MTPRCREGQGRWVDSPISQLGRPRWSVTQRRGVSQARALGSPAEPRGQEEEPEHRSRLKEPLTGQACGAQTEPSPLSSRGRHGAFQTSAQNSSSRVENSELSGL